MDKSIEDVAKRSLRRLLAYKKEKLESAVTVGEYWKIQCEVNNIVKQLNTNEDGDKN